MFSYTGKKASSPRKQKAVVVGRLLFGFLVLGLDLISALVLTLFLIYCHKLVAPLFEDISGKLSLAQKIGRFLLTGLLFVVLFIGFLLLGIAFHKLLSGLKTSEFVTQTTLILVVIGGFLALVGPKLHKDNKLFTRASSIALAMLVVFLVQSVLISTRWSEVNPNPRPFGDSVQLFETTFTPIYLGSPNGRREQWFYVPPSTPLMGGYVQLSIHPEGGYGEDSKTYPIWPLLGGIVRFYDSHCEPALDVTSYCPLSPGEHDLIANYYLSLDLHSSWGPFPSGLYARSKVKSIVVD